MTQSFKYWPKLTGLLLCLIIPLSLQGETYRLDTFLDQVEIHSRDLELAKKELDMAAVYKREALATALPKISLQADYKRNLKENFLYIDFPNFETGEMTNQKFKINYKNDYGFQAVINTFHHIFQIVMVGRKKDDGFRFYFGQCRTDFQAGFVRIGTGRADGFALQVFFAFMLNSFFIMAHANHNKITEKKIQPGEGRKKKFWKLSAIFSLPCFGI